MILSLLTPIHALAQSSHKHHHRHSQSGSSLSEGQKALAQAQAARKALQAKQAQAARDLLLQQAAAQAAQREAQKDKIRQNVLTHQSNSAENAVISTRAHIAHLSNEIHSLLYKKTLVEKNITQQNAAIQPLLPIAVRLSIAPNAALLATPGNIKNNVTALSVLAGFSRLTRQKINQLQDNETELQSIGNSLDARQKELDTLLKTQSHKRDVITAKAQIATQTENKARQTALQAQHSVALAMKASADLSNEIDALARQEAQAKAALEAEARTLAKRHQMEQAHKAQAQAQALSAGNGVSSGNGHAPVAGRIAVRWGENTEAGPSTGITYATSSAMLVQAPCSGRIVFSGPFRSFGEMLILDCGQNYRFVLSGLGSLNVSIGQNVKKAASLGSMPATDGLLFVQLRHGTKIVSPAPFL
ncbi:murein hydrolase activator EnvC family protein [Swingsia samuiensis]|uniref:murein hydrolase activator EnvC family protein n=1 Tax=Swingsia samuiensis TaxID=1293412 RepID=UPI001FEA33A0|nr:peptidoglycan DD-metalloendopeptidase family protein [Swingsia samuiensis]